jgi:choline dehydrogenase-like flavoprotein
MPDVIVIGAGGGGPVMAKELAARGLDVLLLEAGPWFRDPEHEWSKFEHDANDPLTGYFRFGPSDRSKPAWFRETPQNSFLWQLAGVGGTTQHYYGNCPRAQPGVFEGYSGSDAGSFDGHRFPFTYQELIPYYEWVEATLPVQTAAMGTKEQLFFEGAQGIGLPVNTTKDITRNSFRPQENAILQPQGTAGKTSDSSQLDFPQAKGCTFCGYCFEGCVEPRKAPRNLKAKRSTDNSYAPMALTADAWAPGGKAVTLLPDAYVDEVLYQQQGSRTVATGVRWHDTNTGQAYTETAQVVVMAGGLHRGPAPLPEQRAAQPERLGRPRIHRPLLRLGVRGVRRVHRQLEGRGIVGTLRLPRSRRTRERGPPPGASGVQHGLLGQRHPGPLRQRPRLQRLLGRDDRPGTRR